MDLKERKLNVSKLKAVSLMLVHIYRLANNFQSGVRLLNVILFQLSVKLIWLNNSL